MNFRYGLTIYWREADKAFIAEVPDLPGCLADGESYQAAVQNVEVVIQEWVDTAKDLGRSIPEDRERSSSEVVTSTNTRIILPNHP